MRRRKLSIRSTRSRRHWRLILTWSTLVVLQFTISSIVLAQPTSLTFREAVSVNVETQVVKKLETAREHIIEGQWDTAVAMLMELRESGVPPSSPRPGR